MECEQILRDFPSRAAFCNALAQAIDERSSRQSARPLNSSEALNKDLHSAPTSSGAGARSGGAARAVSQSCAQAAQPAVAGVQLEQRIPMYGYHSHAVTFARIFLFDPFKVKAVVSLLQSGRVLGRAFQPYEAHVPYLLQFMVDYNIAGMSNMRLRDPMFRVPLPSIASTRSVHVQCMSSQDQATPAAPPTSSTAGAGMDQAILSPQRPPSNPPGPTPPLAGEPCVPLPSSLPFTARQWAAGEVTLSTIHSAGLACHTDAFFWRKGMGSDPNSSVAVGRDAAAEKAAESVWVAGGSSAAPQAPHRPPIQKLGEESFSRSPLTSEEVTETYQRCSVCELEVDVLPEQIENPSLRKAAAVHARQRIAEHQHTDSIQSQPDALSVAMLAGGVQVAPGLLAVSSLAELWTEENQRRSAFDLAPLKPPGIDALRGILNRSAADDSFQPDVHDAFPFVCQLPPQPLLHSQLPVHWTAPGSRLRGVSPTSSSDSLRESALASVFGSSEGRSAVAAGSGAVGEASPPTSNSVSPSAEPAGQPAAQQLPQQSVADCKRSSLPEEWRDIFDSQMALNSSDDDAGTAVGALLPPRLRVKRPKHHQKRKGSKRRLLDIPVQPDMGESLKRPSKASHTRVVSFATHPAAPNSPSARTSTLLQPTVPPPHRTKIEGAALGMQRAFYATSADLGGRSTVEFFGRQHKLASADSACLQAFDAADSEPEDIFTAEWSQGQLPLAKSSSPRTAAFNYRQGHKQSTGSVILQPSEPPPSCQQVIQSTPSTWGNRTSFENAPLQRPASMSSGSGSRVEDVSFETLSQAGFQRKPERLQASSSTAQRADVNQQLTSMCVEVIAACRGALSPDAAQDELLAIVVSVSDDNIVSSAPGALEGNATTTGYSTNRRGHVSGVIFVDKQRHQWPGCTPLPPEPKACTAGLLPESDARAILHANMRAACTAVSIVDRALQLQQPLAPVAGAAAAIGFKRRLWAWPVPDEASALAAFAWCTRAWDADILMSYDTQKMGLGYIMKRAKALGVELGQLLSRTPYGPESVSAHFKANKDAYGANHGGGGGLWVVGRDVLNVWRIMRSEVKLPMYSLQFVCEKVLKLRLPTFSAATIASAFSSGLSHRSQAISHVVKAAEASLSLLDHLNVIGRTSEMARLFGIDFHSVLTRGSQFRVEAVMLRVAKPLGFSPPSASREQVAQQPAMELVPLILEPRSRLYRCPVIVLDFQSLYPSVIIAYNLCFTTCLGKLKAEVQTGPSETLGFMPFKPLADECKRMGSGIFTTKNNVSFVPKSVRTGILPRMLQEILETRVMVKSSMKLKPAKEDPVMTRILNARQFALKMIANVTYGYTSAGFSGRMPCAEIADSIVQTGRTTLERAIDMVETNLLWKARVVYGDTDSMFVAVPGRSLDAAWRIGAEIASQVTASNPPPVKLKLEKVYTSSVLVSKKRYAGFMLESPNQVTPHLDVKGLEAVRRDACQGVQKAMQDVLKMLFSEGNLSQVKTYLHRLWFNIVQGSVTPSDWVFAREVRLGMYRGPTPPPSAIVATRAMYHDPQAAPLYGERVPFLVIYGAPAARLVDLVISPDDFIASKRSQLNAVYYITKCLIPSLERILNLCGADVAHWLADFREAHSMRQAAKTTLESSSREQLAAVQSFSAKSCVSERNYGLGRRPSPSIVHSGMFAAAARTPTNPSGENAGTVDTYYRSQRCSFCGSSSQGLACASCLKSVSNVDCSAVLQRRGVEARKLASESVCRSCASPPLWDHCKNYGCNNLWHLWSANNNCAGAHSACVSSGVLFCGEVRSILNDCNTE